MSAMGALDGFTVGVTADRRAEDQAKLLMRLGARVVHGATVATAPIDHLDTDLVQTTEAIIEDPPDLMIATTGIGMRAWFDAVEAAGRYEALAGALAGVELLARGPKAAGACTTAGFSVSWRAPSEQGIEMLEHVLARETRPARVVVQRDGGLAPVLAEALEAEGVDTVDLRTYRWHEPDDPGPASRLIDTALDGRLDAITFTSAPALGNLLTLADRTGRIDALLDRLNRDGMTVACVGPVCAGQAHDHGIGQVVTPRRARLGAMVAALGEACRKRRRVLVVDGREVTLQGSKLVVGGQVVELSDRERSLLEVLSDRPGAVVGKTELMDRCWGDAAEDDHVVEVTVARLRRRLGDLDAIRTIRRRGYRLAV